MAGVYMEPGVGDAFGAALLACVEADMAPGTVAEIIERDDGRIDTGDMARYFELPGDERTDWVLSRARGRVLDIGSGAGRYVLALQARGQDAVALDVSPGALEVCRRRGVRQTFLGTVHDLADREPAAFDTFLLMGNNLGLLGGPDATARFLAALARLGRPRARILAVGNDAHQTSNPEHLAYMEENRRRGRPDSLITIRVRHGRVADAWFDYLMPSLAELDALLVGSGWSVAETFEEPGRSQYIVALERV